MRFAFRSGSSPHSAAGAYHFTSFNCMRDCAPFPVVVAGFAKKICVRAFKEAYGRTLKRSYSSVNILRTGEPEAPRGARRPATPAAALAQRLRGVVVDGRSDCPAQTSAFRDAAIRLVCSRSLTSRDRLRGRVCALRRCASLRNTSEAALACASMAGGVFSERPIGLRSICDVAAHQERATALRPPN